jgi:hypothetical protein
MISTLLTVLTFLTVSTVPSVFPSFRPSDSPTDGAALITTMHSRYVGKWYTTLTFVQTTTMTRPVPRKETWYEAARIPGFLRIDIAPLDSGSAILFRKDSLYRFSHGQMVRSRAFVHPLMVLGFDVYADPPEQTITKLKDLHFDLSKIHETTWQGRPTYVVGAEEGDTTSPQFWVDRERLLFVRMLEPAPDGSRSIAETQFNRYEKLGKGWIAIEVVFSVNGDLVTKEEYADVKRDVKLPDALFDPAAYAKPEWVR